jgi:hypothetical protein
MNANTPDRDQLCHPIFVQVTNPRRRKVRPLQGRVGHVLYSQRRADLTALQYLICFSDQVAWLQPHELTRLDQPGNCNCSGNTHDTSRPS